MELDLEGKTAIITGGSGGIGQGLVMEFAREGINVVSASRNTEIGYSLTQRAKAEGYKGKVLAVATDVTDRSSVDAAVKAANKTFGKVDILVNNAGGAHHVSPFEDFDEEGQNWEIDLNIKGVVNCCQAVAKDMLDRGGAIINISSNSALLGEASAHIVHYGASKGFVNSFTKALAWEWAKRGVRVNNICPGWIVPEHEDVSDGSFWKKYGFDMMGRPDEMQKALEDGTLFNMSGLPIPKLGRPEDIAWMSLFLASDKSRYITGQLISVSGGAYMP